MFTNRVLLITGGTGTFGNAVLRRFLETEIGEIRVFSRDEKKQDDMRKEYAHPKLRFYIGDVREEGSLRDAMAGVDFVFHAAALKQVPSCEFFRWKRCAPTRLAGVYWFSVNWRVYPSPIHAEPIQFEVKLCPFDHI